jgi:hypothetical protein
MLVEVSSLVSLKSPQLLTVLTFEQAGAKVLYCPALAVTGYGYDMHEAESSFQVALDAFIEDIQVAENCVFIMQSLGWSKSNDQWESPQEDKLLLNDATWQTLIVDAVPFNREVRVISLTSKA